MGPWEHVWVPAPKQSFMKTCMHYTGEWSVIVYMFAGMFRHMWTSECLLQVCAYASHVSDTLSGLLDYKLGTWRALGSLSTQERHNHPCLLMKTLWKGPWGCNHICLELRINGLILGDSCVDGPTKSNPYSY